MQLNAESWRWVTIALLVLLAAIARVINFGSVTSRTPDERVYTRQAHVWLHTGQPGVRSLVDEYKRDSLVRHYPTPTRVGMITLLGLTMRLTGRTDERVGSIVSSAAAIASVLVLAVLGLRFMPFWAASAALLLYAVFPPSLAIARRTWSDGVTELAALLMVWFACETIRRP